MLLAIGPTMLQYIIKSAKWDYTGQTAYLQEELTRRAARYGTSLCQQRQSPTCVSKGMCAGDIFVHLVHHGQCLQSTALRGMCHATPEIRDTCKRRIEKQEAISHKSKPAERTAQIKAYFDPAAGWLPVHTTVYNSNTRPSWTLPKYRCSCGQALSTQCPRLD